MKRFCLSVVCLLSIHGSAQVNPAGPTTEWKAVPYSNNTIIPDPALDQQTGSEEGDVVGNASEPALYTQFYNGGTPSLTDGSLAFRFRLGSDKSPPGFSGDALVGLDVNRDGKLDF